eukprot:1148650-Pelagomonas_calceolata.AAC.9
MPLSSALSIAFSIAFNVPAIEICSWAQGAYLSRTKSSVPKNPRTLAISRLSNVPFDAPHLAPPSSLALAFLSYCSAVQQFSCILKKCRSKAMCFWGSCTFTPQVDGLIELHDSQVSSGIANVPDEVPEPSGCHQGGAGREGPADTGQKKGHGLFKDHKHRDESEDGKQYIRDSVKLHPWVSKDSQTCIMDFVKLYPWVRCTCQADPWVQPVLCDRGCSL